MNMHNNNKKRSNYRTVEMVETSQKNTVIISAFQGCGKSYAAENLSHSCKILDSDSSQFSWTVTETGTPVKELTRERNPNFPANYIEHIKENIGKVDIIFVSTHVKVREELTAAHIPFVTVCPNLNERNEYIGRYYTRGSSRVFIDMMNDKWVEYLTPIHQMCDVGLGLYELQAGEYLDAGVISTLIVFVANAIRPKYINRKEG